MKECEKYREMISAMLDGELDAGEGERLIAHLSSCAECRELYELLSSVTGSEVWQLPEVPEGLHGHIMSGVRAAAAEKKKSARVMRLRPLAVAAACLAVIVGVVFGVPRVFRMGSSGDSGAGAFNTSVSANSGAAPASHDNAGTDTAAADVPADSAGEDQSMPAADSDFEGAAGNTSSCSGAGGAPEA
ncbi:MAG: zf-HC2 domain-containing protein, partial [Butyricicoccus sp.]|nr:zf-HC2 domain-containing protein [Butyricicoccus sp.]